MVLSWLQGLFRIGKDSPQYLLQIHEQTALEPDNIPGTDCFPHRLGQSQTVGVFPGIRKTGGIAEAFYGMLPELQQETMKRLPEEMRAAYELFRRNLERRM